MTMLIVFDTCTQEEYRRDVHRVLAMPAGGIVRYEYKRHLFSKESLASLESISASSLPIDALLMYGELKTFRRGQSEKGWPMLTWANANFTPTRSARVRNVYVHDDVIHFHLELRGFLDPGNPHIEPLLRALEAVNQLPFGAREEQYCWISMLPSSMQPVEVELKSDAAGPWSRVIDWLFEKDTQFKGDAFWRLLRVYPEDAQDSAVALRERSTNRFGRRDWFADYLVHDLRRYSIEYQTYEPSAHGSSFPANAKLALVPNDAGDGIVRVPSALDQLRPNHVTTTSFNLQQIAFLGRRYASIELETRLTNSADIMRDPGSRCTLTIGMSKSPGRLAAVAILALLAVSSTGLAGVLKDGPIGRIVLLLIVAAICGLWAGYLWTGKAKAEK